MLNNVNLALCAPFVGPLATSCGRRTSVDLSHVAAVVAWMGGETAGADREDRLRTRTRPVPMTCRNDSSHSSRSDRSRVRVVRLGAQ